ncbi:iron-sulfur cluster assembly scaffold protein [Candidatus Omnitrophota bacterium]
MAEDLTYYPKQIVTLAKSPKHFGRMNDPTSSACIKGPCGDEMEFYLTIKDKFIEDATFYTKGCIATIVCGSMTAQLAAGKSVNQALGLSPRKVIEALNGLPEDNCHCSILAVSALYRAIADYLLKK